MTNDANDLTDKMLVQQLGSMMLAHTKLAAQYQVALAELGKLKSEAAAKPARKTKASAPKPNGKADVSARA